MASKTTEFEVGPRLASLRRLRQRSQRSVADGAELAPSYLSRIENGRVQPTFPTVLRILRSLGCDMGEFLEPTRITVKRRGTCPVTVRGRCLLDSIKSEAHANRKDDRYTPREARLINRFATWIKSVEPTRLRAMEVLLEDWLRSAQG